MSNRTYDILKWVALVALDAIGLFYCTMSEIWGLPCGEQVIRTCAAVSLMLGAMIGVAGATYTEEDYNELIHGIADDGKEADEAEEADG